MPFCMAAAISAGSELWWTSPLKPSFMSSVAVLDSRRMCSLPASPSGTMSAIAQVTGFSSKLGQSRGSAFFRTTTAARATEALFACGMAKPSVMPVSPMASRAMKAWRRASASSAMPSSAAFRAMMPMASSREAAC